MANTVQVWSQEIIDFIKTNITHDAQGVLYWKVSGQQRKAGDRVRVSILRVKVFRSHAEKQYYQFGFRLKSSGKVKLLKVHHIVYFLEYGKQPSGYIDHIDGNGLNNAPANLRDVTQSQNMQNRKPQHKKTSKFKGVSKSAYVNSSGERHFITAIKPPMSKGAVCVKCSKNEIECARAYDLASIVLHGDYGYRNFPDADYSATDIENMRQFINNKLSLPACDSVAGKEISQEVAA